MTVVDSECEGNQLKDSVHNKPLARSLAQPGLNSKASTKLAIELPRHQNIPPKAAILGAIEGYFYKGIEKSYMAIVEITSM